MENWQAVGHRWSEWITTTEPTESTAGTAVRNCYGCGAEETRALPQLVPGHTHEYVSEVTVTPTCTSEGLMTYTCACGDTYTENMNMTRHTYNHGYGQDSTCTEAGYAVDVCGSCGNTIRRDILPTGHAWGVWVTITEPTDSTTGLAEHTCSTCGAKENKILDQSDSSHVHQYVETDRQESTCDLEGYRSYACSCGSTLTQKLPTKGHSSKKQIIDPTCTEDGVENYVCTLCGAVEPYRVIPSLGHSWSAWATIQPPTENAEGYAERTCSRCSSSETKTLPPVSVDHTHAYSEEIALRPTCTDEGMKSFVCECGDAYTETIPATGHDFRLSGGKEPTCTESGRARYTCLVCDFEKTDTLPPTGHNWSEWVTVQEPDVGVEGIAQRTCSWCNSQETKSLDPLPAPPPETVAEAPVEEPTP